MPRPILPEVMKARAGVPISDLLALLWAKKLQGYSITTITGVPPLSFLADGRPLISWSMLGNTQQTGTPTPQNPIMPTFCGVRTANLWRNLSNYSGNGVTIQAKDDGLYFSGTCTASTNVNVNAPLAAGTYTMKANANRIPSDDTYACIQIYWNTSNIPTIQNRNAVSGDFYFAVQSDVESVQYRIRLQNGVNYDGFILRPTLNSGGTALPFEPFGYKLPITSAGQTQAVFLGQVQTVRRIRKLVLTGNESFVQHQIVQSWFQTNLNEIVVDGLVVSTNYVQTVHQIGNMTDGEIYVGKQNESDKGRVVFKDTRFTEKDDFKAYLAAQYAAGTPVIVWYVLATPETGIINEPLAKIGTYADELHSEDAGITIPTVKGENTMTVETELQPSSVSITGHIKPV